MKKKMLVLALTAIALAVPATAPVAVADPPYRDHDRRDDRDRDHADRDHRDGDRGRVDRDWRHDRSEWRDERRDDRWDAERHNGYWYGERWSYGPPPEAYFGRPGFILGYHPWARGAVLPHYYFDRRYYVDYHRYHLRRPPRGYYWVRDERGDYLLAAIATGIIADIIINAR